MRLGLNSAQRDAASTRLSSAILRATIEIDQTFRDYGRNTPSKSIKETTLNGAISAGATTVTLTSSTGFSTAGNGDIDGDSFAWTGKSSNDLTGCTGISGDHASGVTVSEGEMAHILRQICADLAAAIYYEDESTFQTGVPVGGMRGTMLRDKGMQHLLRLAHLGSVD
tara:strand:- start:24 stop:527 length:504 start_codon:yes stop_codon:yes gene_type:complete